MKRGTPDHPKTLWLKAGLGLSKVEVVGLLELLFHFTGRCAPQGDIGKWTNKQIAEGVFWERDPDELVRHLVESGFIDLDKRHRLMVHDWEEHADQAVKKYLGRNHLKFFPVSGRRPTNSIRRRTAVAVAQPSQAEPSQAGPPETPPASEAPPDVAHERARRRIGAPGELEAMQGETSELLAEVSLLTGRPQDELLVAMSGTPNGKAILSIQGCMSLPWLRTTRDRLLVEKLSVQGRARASPVEPTRAAQAREDAAMAGIQGGLMPTTSKILEGMRRDRPRLGGGNGALGGEPPGPGPDAADEGLAGRDDPRGPGSPDR